MPLGLPAAKPPFSKPPFSKYFDAEDLGDEWRLYCKLCEESWRLAKASGRPAGSLLPLLEHSCPPPKGSPLCGALRGFARRLGDEPTPRKETPP